MIAAGSNVGKWDRWYGIVGDEPEPYALTDTYKIGADWLASCDLVSDWGCGKGWLRTLIESEHYIGYDGSHSPFADEIVDLADFRRKTPGLFMRHVLEHDFRWADILDNALASFTDRMALILFTPFADETHDSEWEPDPGVPNLSFRLEDLTSRMDTAGVKYELRTIESASKYGVEHVFFIER